GKSIIDNTITLIINENINTRETNKTLLTISELHFFILLFRYSIEYTFCVTVLNPIFVIEKKAVNDVITIQSLYKDFPQ
ncbi:hypothetical protein, partial [Parabacteroides goldsteinii]|uniref:hypothetical protein n=1 Tax=Parabacteroides goldsteinii TaxID=328812 RepID=UPI001F439A1A